MNLSHPRYSKSSNAGVNVEVNGIRVSHLSPEDNLGLYIVRLQLTRQILRANFAWIVKCSRIGLATLFEQSASLVVHPMNLILAA